MEPVPPQYSAPPDLTDDDAAWRQRARCRTGLPSSSEYLPEHVAKWYPGRGAPVDDGVAVCARCPVRADCLAYAITVNENHGTWGGLATRPRRRVRQDRNRYGLAVAIAMAMAEPLLDVADDLAATG